MSNRLSLTFIDKISIIFYDLTPKILLFVAVLLTGMFIGFISLSDLSSFSYYYDEVGTTTGYVDRIEDANASINGSEVLGYFFSYQVGGESYFAESFSHTLYFDEGEKVSVEYIISDPYRARIIGSNSSVLGPWLVLIIGFLWFVFIIIFVFKLKKHMGIINILNNRVSTTGIKKSTVETNVSVNENKVYKMEYEYTAMGTPKIAIAKSTNPNDFLDEESLFYDKNFPEKAVLYKKLPGRIIKKLN